MTDAVTFYRTIISQVTQFVGIWEDLQLISARIGADSSLSTAAATAAQAGGRADLMTADFDNIKAAIDSISTRLNSNDPSVNSATVRLPFFKML